MSERATQGFLSRLVDRIGRRLLASQADAGRVLRRDLDALRAQSKNQERHLKDLAALHARAEAAARGARAELTTIRQHLERLTADRKDEAAQGRRVGRQINALVRAQYLNGDLPAPHWIQSRRFQLRAQNEEDGVLLALLAETGIQSRRFVEIGSGSTGGNSAVLAHDMGWGGVMVESRTVAVERLREELKFNPDVTVIEARVDAAGINALLRQAGAVGDIDVLSIDIDSIDYWIFEALDVCQARVVVLEYNVHFGPTRAVTLPNAERPEGAPKYYFGASLAALEKLARRKGYRLVLCEAEGVNAFFVREGLAPAIPTVTPAMAYRPQKRRVRDRTPALSPEQIFTELAASGLPLVEV